MRDPHRRQSRSGVRTCAPNRHIRHLEQGRTWTMSQNVTLSTMISPAQQTAITALVSGSTVTVAAGKAGVARETVSRWLHRDPAFMAELQNSRAEMAAQTRCALESLGMPSVAVLRRDA